MKLEYMLSWYCLPASERCNGNPVFFLHQALKMKQLLLTTTLLLFTTFLMAQPEKPDLNDPYQATWAKLDSLLQRGQTRSAYEFLQTEKALIQEDVLAHPERYPYLIKATVTVLELGKNLEENGNWKAIRELEEITRLAGAPEKAIYQSYLAEQYHQYWQQNRWQLQNRTVQIDAEPGDDATSWSSANLLERITALYLSSVAEHDTRSYSIENIQPLLATGNEGFELLPTVYDLLLHRALTYFRTNDAFLNEPQYEPALNKLDLLHPAAEFIQLELPKRDESSSSYRHTLELLQEALAWSLNNRKDTKAHLDLDLSRLQIVYDKLTLTSKHEAYQQALSQLEQQYANTPLLADVMLEQAHHFYERGNAYDPGNPTTEHLRWYFKKTIELLAQIQSRFPKTLAAERARSFHAQIRQPGLTVSIEQVQLPQQYSLGQIRFQNLEAVHYRIVAGNPNESSEQSYEELVKRLLAKKATHSWSEALPQAGDYRQHTTEFAMPALGFGKYYLVASANADFPIAENQTVALEFWVSSLSSIITTAQAEGKLSVMVVDRESGRPVQGAMVGLWQYQRSGRFNREQNLALTETLTTDKNGQVNLLGGEFRNLLLQVKKGEDQIFIKDPQYLTVGGIQPSRQRQLTFFTDRGLYRPGQPLYFKALLLEKVDGVPKIVPNEEVEVTLMDANRQEVEKLKLRTNRYGSVSGQFSLPAAGLLGQMSLRGTPGRNWHYFRVEEYKRPRFEVVIAQMEDEPALNQTVEVTGTAKAYAGPAIEDAEVRYTVIRSMRFPWYRSWYYGGGTEQTLVSGVTRTDSDGQFTIEFVAEPDADVNTSRFPLYNFDIRVEVVDGTGETRTASQNISLTKYPFQLQLMTASSADRKEGLELQATCTNLVGAELTKNVQLKIYRLDSPARSFIERYWDFPDTVTIPERTFRKRLGRFAYAKTELQGSWPTAETVTERSFELEGTDTLQLDVKDWKVGHYRAELLVVTPEGDSLSTSTDFRLDDWRDRAFATDKQFQLRTQTEGPVEPGTAVNLQIGGSSGPDRVYGNWRNKHGEVAEGWVSIAEQLQQEVQEKDRGGLSWKAFYVWQNRFYQLNHHWSVPWSNKALSVEFETFRSKIYPGQEEEWTIRIDGPDRDAAAAEVLASMYDASLDQILPFNWSFSPYPYGVSQVGYRPLGFRQQQRYVTVIGPIGGPAPGKIYPALIRVASYGYRPSRYSSQDDRGPVPEAIADEGGGRPQMAMNKARDLPMRNVDALAATTAGVESAAEDSASVSPPKEQGGAEEQAPPVKIRTNLAETAFFFPEIATDEEGRVVLRFTSPESLTRWKLQVLAHDENLAYSLDSKELITQKELMILPNAPRFLREGDEIYFTAKVSNLSEQALTGSATLELFDLDDNTDLGERYQLTSPTQAVQLDAASSEDVRWRIRVPKDAVGTLGYRVLARAEDFADGEEAALPVLTNRVLITEAQPLFVRGEQTKTFTLPNLVEAGASADHQAVQLHITSNPAWEAIKALPYLQEYPYDCTEQIVNRLFANTLARKVVEDFPETEAIFEQWRRSAEGLESPLEQNEELKTALLEETPWVRDAQAETLQRKRIALLFDKDRLNTEWAVAQQKLLRRQQPNGAFSWFPEGRENIYMTQYVAEQFSHLRELTGQSFDQQLQNALDRAVRFCDSYYYERYQEWKKKPEHGLPLGPRTVHYLYLRSLNPRIELANGQQEALEVYWEKTIEKWLDYGILEQALLGQAAARTKRDDLAQMILTSLQERSLHSQEMGRYWNQNHGFYWYQNPIETQAKLIEFFAEMKVPAEQIAEMKIWLLRNKETNRWETTKATASAVHALLTTGDNWLAEAAPLEVSFPKAAKASYEGRLETAQANAEAGTGAYQVKWTREEVQADLGTVRLRNSSKAPGWGGLYWQHFQTIDEVERNSDNPLRIERALFRKVNNGQGDQLEALTTNPMPGDKITVRLVVRTDRDLEFVHLKDLRASGLEPTEQLSTYRYQGGLGYYQQATDLGTHFFIDYLPKGEYVLEYDIRVFHAGDFSGGLSTIQCMYAPKFTSHSEGRRLSVDK